MHLFRLSVSLLLVASPCLVVENLALTPEKLPIAYWKFDELAGSAAIDSSGNGHTGTIVAAITAPGKNGQALSFDGVDDYVLPPTRNPAARLELVSTWERGTGQLRLGLRPHPPAWC